MTTELGGRKSKAQERAARVARLVEQLENVDLELAEGALAILRDSGASPSVRVQAGQLLGSVRERIEPPRATADEGRDDWDDVRFAAYKLCIMLGLFGPSLSPTFPMLETPPDLKTIPQAKAAIEARIAELTAMEAELRERVARVEQLQQHLEEVERRPLAAAKAPESAETPPESRRDVKF